MHRILDNLRWALRSLIKTPGFTATAILILALGIGANAAIFSLVDRVLLQPLPYREPDRLVAIAGAVPTRGRLNNPLSAPDFLDWQRETSCLESMAGVDNTAKNLTGGTEPQIVPAGRVSWNFFQVIGVHPALGRDFTPEEDRAEGPKAVILTHEMWMRRFGGDPALVGRSIRLDGLDTQVVGIMPPGFRFSYHVGGADMLLPMAFVPGELTKRGEHFFGCVGRLKPGATVAAANEDLKAIAARLATTYPDTNRNFTANVSLLQSQIVRNSRGTLLVLLGAVAFVLLIACANLMNLMLARGARRQREMAIRAALGAGPATLIGAALAESLILGLMGGAVGLLLARWTMAGLVEILGMLVPGLRNVPMEPRLVLFTFGLSAAAAMLFGLVPALKLEGLHLSDSLKEGKGSSNASHPRLRGLLVASETALATALLIGAGLMLRSLQHLHSVDPGFKAGHVLTVHLSLPEYKYKDVPSRAALVDGLLHRLAASPGVEAAAVNDTPPFQGSTSSSGYDLRGQLGGEGQEAIDHHISTGYFKAMGIPILKGRDFAPGETEGVLISEGTARRDFPHSDPLQGAISMDAATEPFIPVIGVVGNVHHHSLTEDPHPEMYFALANTHSGGFAIQHFVVMVRTSAAPAAMEATLKQALRELDPDLPLGSIRTLEYAVAQDRQAAKARGLLLGSFAGLALLLSGIGIYAVINFLTALRTREIGVRMALGARVADVVRLVVGQGLRMALGGVAVGVVIALVMGRFLDTLIAGVKFWDPSTLGLVVSVLALVAAAACLLPALRASRVDPMIALRSE